MLPSELSENQLWLNGPEWLATSSYLSDSPVGIDDDLPEQCYSELKRHTAIQLFMSNDHVNRPQLKQIINYENFNSFNHLIRVTALVLKFAHLLLQKIKQTSELINSNTLNDAKLYWLMESQRLLPQDRRFVSWKHQFDLYLDSSHL